MELDRSTRTSDGRCVLKPPPPGGAKGCPLGPCDAPLQGWARWLKADMERWENYSKRDLEISTYEGFAEIVCLSFDDILPFLLHTT